MSAKIASTIVNVPIVRECPDSPMGNVLAAGNNRPAIGDRILKGLANAEPRLKAHSRRYD